MKVTNGAALKELRETAGYTQRKLGKLVNVTSPYISDIERNRRACPPDIYEVYMALIQPKKRER